MSSREGCINNCDSKIVQGAAQGAGAGAALGAAVEVVLYVAADIVTGGLVTAGCTILGAIAGIDAAERSSDCCEK